MFGKKHSEEFAKTFRRDLEILKKLGVWVGDRNSSGYLVTSVVLHRQGYGILFGSDDCREEENGQISVFSKMNEVDFRSALCLMYLNATINDKDEAEITNMLISAYGDVLIPYHGRDMTILQIYPLFKTENYFPEELRRFERMGPYSFSRQSALPWNKAFEAFHVRLGNTRINWKSILP